MAYALIASTSKGTPDGNTFTTDAIDTSGANLIVIVESFYNGSTNPTLSDNKSNTPFGSGQQSTTATNFICSIAFFKNPTVGSGHTFTLTGASVFGVLCVAAFSGATTNPLDNICVNHNDGGTSVTFQDTGLVTPAEDNELLIAGNILVDAGDTSSIDGTFILQEHQALVGGQHQGGALAYKIQTSLSAEDPTLTFSTSTRAGTMIAGFKAQGGTKFVLIPGR